MSHSRTQLSKLWVLLVASLTVAALLGACSDDNPKPEDQDGSGGSAQGGDTGTGGGGTGGSNVQPGVTGTGLALTIDDVTVTSQGVATVDFTITDTQGHPLDLDGYLTAGAVSPRFILSWLGENSNGESTQYTAYTLRTKDGPDGKPVTQSSYDADGVYTTLELGKYRYTLGTKIDVTEDRRGLTHTLGVYATRELAGEKFVASALESWVPSGKKVETTLDVVNDTACNSCHTRLEFHGGSRRGVEMCQLCHTESNSTEPVSGNTIDFQVMIHKIHRGSSLPSVVGGTPYVFGEDKDYSDVVYPWDMKDCAKCHQGSQGERWVTRPAEKPCSSCHDRTYFGSGATPEGWTKHTGGPRDDSECIVCHGEDSLEPITKSHRTALSYPEMPVLVATIHAVTQTAPGETPIIEFSVTQDGAPIDLSTMPMNRLRTRIWGPTNEAVAVTSSGETISSTSGTTTTSAPACADPAVPPCLEKNGTHFLFHAATPIPLDALGSRNAGLDGRISWLDPDVEGATAINIPFVNPIFPFAVTGDVMPRRHVVTRDACNTCHGDLGAHGGSYKDPAYCTNCHTPELAVGPEDLTAGSSGDALSFHFKDLIHRIHSTVRYPAPLNDCEHCHDGTTYFVPLTSGLRPSKYGTASCPDGSSDCEADVTYDLHDVPPQSAACTSCHSDAATVVHAETNSSPNGEACATCHGDGKDRSVAKVHALSP